MALATTGDGGGVLWPLHEDGSSAGRPRAVPDLAAAVTLAERDRPRWLWNATNRIYPWLLAAGVRVERCHDLTLTGALLAGYRGQWGQPVSAAAQWDRLAGRPPREDPPPPRPPGDDTQEALFGETAPGDPVGVEALAAVYLDQLASFRTAAEQPAGAGLRLLAAAESAGALAAAEMGHTGLPWNRDAHDRLLTELLGPRPSVGAAPVRLAELTRRIQAAFGGQPVNPDSPAQVLAAFTRAGITIASTRSHLLRAVDHPAVAPLLEQKELARLYTAHGWAWLDTWVRAGRFHPEYVVAGVVSGRWASRGGGALQIPRPLRRAVQADPGWRLVVADAAQLEPRVLAALSGDRGLVAAAAGGDLYTGLATEAFGGDRPRAKIALLAAMYGQTGGEAGQLLGVLRQRFPTAVRYVEAAAEAGETGQVVRSRLGRTCPPPGAGWDDGLEGADPDSPARQAAIRSARSRSRFTRNFVIQASASDWALVLLAAVRRRLQEVGGGAELVFFQHDEVMVHCPADEADAVVALLRSAAAEAQQLVFGPGQVRLDLAVNVVERYSDAK